MSAPEVTEDSNQSPEPPVPDRPHKKTSINPFEHEVVHPKYLKYIRKPYYRYSGNDYSICSKLFMNKFWNQVVKLMPWTLAPNLITLTGFIFCVSMLVVSAYYHMTSPDNIPAHCWAYCGFALFAYQTLDAIDGKQARRTETGSSLGELFDHGADSLFCLLLQVCVSLHSDLSVTTRTIHIFCVGTSLFMMLFEQYCTGTLDLPMINGPVEGLLIISSCFFLTSIKGVAWWSDPWGFDIPFFVWGNTRLALSCWNHVYVAISIVGTPLTIFGNITHILTLPRAHDHIRNPFLYVLVPHAVILIGMIWVAVDWTQTRILVPFGIESLYGLLCSFTVTRLTISRLCRSPYQFTSKPYTMVCCYIVLCIAARLGLVYNMLPADYTEEYIARLLGIIAYLMCVIELYSYMHMIISVFRQFSKYLGINILSMTEQQKKRALEIAAGEKFPAKKKA